MNQNNLIAVALLLLTACNNAPEREKEPADTVTVQANASMEEMISKAIEDSGVHVDYADFTKFLDQRPANSGLWESHPFQTDLQQLLGTDYAIFRESMTEATELKKDRVYYSWGILPDDAVKGFSYVLIDAENKKLAAYQNINGTVKEWKTPGEDLYIPREIARKKTEIK